MRSDARSEKVLMKGGTEKQTEHNKNYSKGDLEKSGHTSNCEQQNIKFCSDEYKFILSS